ncbi:GFA family protein [Granulosicoccus sp.]|nr:GFA family protein [Granulosicoccus sp.]MDB4224637.1 GFA family protein [Granulosicoccus sp.]
MCQKQSGTASNAATLVKAGDFRWIGGTEGIKVWKKDSGFNSHFCIRCGSPVPNVIGDKYMWIPVGLIGSVDAEVAVNIFEDTMPQWEDVCVNKSDSKGGVKNVDDLFECLANHTRA